MEKQKSNKGLIIIIIILFLLCLGMGSYIYINENKLIKDETKTNEKIDNSDPLIYGYAYVNVGDNSYKLMALNSNGKDIEIYKGNSLINYFIKDHRLLFTTSFASERPSTNQETYYVDILKDPTKAIQLSNDFEFYDYFDFNSKYIFAQNLIDSGEYGIVRYDLKTGEKMVFDNGVWPYGLYIFYDKLYYESHDTINHGDDYTGEYNTYVSVDFNGENKEEITKEEYKRIESIVGYKDIDYTLGGYFIKNNKKVFVGSNADKLYVDDKVVYSTDDDNMAIDINYSNDVNTIYFMVYEKAPEITNYKLYKLNLDNNKVEEIENDKDKINTYTKIILDNEPLITTQ